MILIYKEYIASLHAFRSSNTEVVKAFLDALRPSDTKIVKVLLMLLVHVNQKNEYILSQVTLNY